MDEPCVEIFYTLADGERIRLKVSIEIKDLLQQSERNIRSQRRQDRRRLVGYTNKSADATIVFPRDATDLLSRMDSYRRLHAAIDNLPEVKKTPSDTLLFQWADIPTDCKNRRSRI
jgi:hypothetical protein